MTWLCVPLSLALANMCAFMHGFGYEPIPAVDVEPI